ncbi:MAG: hypothetical protein AAF434_11335 [Pseudomonadota bacterium]
MTTSPALDIRSLLFKKSWVRLAASAFSLAIASSVSATENLSICTNFSCKEKVLVELDQSHWQRVQRHFLPAPKSPLNERNAIAAAIAEFETIAGEMSVIALDKGGNIDGIGLPGQLDCIAESINTTTFLNALDDNDLLKWHTVGEHSYRRPRIFDQHYAATITIISGAQSWAVDSWHLDNGLQPYIQPVADWSRKVTLPYNPDAE